MVTENFDRNLNISEFLQKGYTIIKGAITDNQLKILLKQSDLLWDKHKDIQCPESKLELDAQIIGRYKAFVDLVSNEHTLPLIISLMGTNIKVSYLGIMFNPPQIKPKHSMKLHQDGGRINFDMDEVKVRPMLSIKAAFWLTDGSVEGKGNFCLIPGSQYASKINIPENNLHPEEEIIFVKPGDVILFDRRVWHSRKRNNSNEMRRVIFYDYSYRWMENKCTFNIPYRIRKNLNINQRILIPDKENYWNTFAPKKEELSFII